RLAAWWDEFASTGVGDVRHVHGGTAAAAAEHVAAALARWHARGEAGADPAFWRQQQENFRSPQAVAPGADALSRRRQYRASMALLMTWVGQVEQAPLEEGEYSFHELALRWMLAVTALQSRDREGAAEDAHRSLTVAAPTRGAELVKKFFDYLE